MGRKEPVVGVDLGGTNVRAALLDGDRLGEIHAARIDPRGSGDEVLEQLSSVIDACGGARFSGIGVGVPSLVDAERGIAYDTLNIPGWSEFPLKRRLEDRYRVPVAVNNDANCFALGEQRFGKGRLYRTFVGLTLGTGLGGGLIIGGRLHAGRLGGAGEFGMIPYRDGFLEHYASGQYFRRVHGIDGEEAARRAAAGDPAARALFLDYGTHLGNALKVVLHAIDPEAVIFGGSVSRDYGRFEAGLRESLRTFPYPRVVDTLKLEVSDLPNAGLMGAAALCLDPA